MRWLLRIFLILLLVIVLVPIVAVVSLNTSTGRSFAMREINHLAAGQIQISGLAGHFPQDLKIATVAISDPSGVWASGKDVELRWKIWGLFSRDLNVTALTAADISIVRTPVTNNAPSQSGSGGVPDFRLDVDKIAIGTLNLGPSLVGQPASLAVNGSAHLHNLTQGNLQLSAIGANGSGNYQIAAAIDPKQIDAHVTIDEPPNGLLGHFAGPQVDDPLHLDLTLIGPRDHAALNFAASVGAAELNGNGSLGLNPGNLGADVTLNVPSLAPIGALAAQRIAGNTLLHLLVTQQNTGTEISLSGNVALTQAPGSLAKLIGPQVHDPLHLDLTLIGPLDHAALNFAASVGAAELNGNGSLGLNPGNLGANVTLNVPSLAPIGALAAQRIAGNTLLHLLVTQQNTGTEISLNGNVALTQAPGSLAKLIGPQGHVTLVVTIANNQATIQNLVLTGAGFVASASGTVASSGFNLTTHLGLDDVAMISPGITGTVTEDGTLTGTAKNFAVSTLLSGDISDRAVPSGPFSITINAQNLPANPSGTLTGSGALENAPLLLDAQFSRDASGGANIHINNALWRSLSATANVVLAQGDVLPTGEAKFAITRLADFSQFSPVPLSGAVDGDFSHQDQENFSLDLNAHNLLVLPSLGSINAKMNAHGPTTALAVKLDSTIAKLLGFPAHVATQGVINLDARAANVANLAASWRSLNAKLLGPTTVETKPDILVHHLALGLNGGTITLDGRLTPAFDFKAAVKNLPASLASLADLTISASGTLSATAAITGSSKAPVGNFTLNAAAVKLHNGPAASLPAANLTASGSLSGRSANINAKLGLGPNANLAAVGLVPLSSTGAISLHVTGATDLRLLDPILAANGTTVRGIITPDLTITGTASAPLANGTVTLADGAVDNISSGLNLTKISAQILAAGRMVTLQALKSTAGDGGITGHGTVNLGDAALPVDLTIDAANATPVSSDLATETIDAALRLTGDLRKTMAMAGTIDILKANINIPKSLPPDVANLPIINRGDKPPPPPPPPPDINLDLTVHAKNQIFIRGDGLFAEVGGKVHITGNAANPSPEGGFTLVRGSFALAGKTLQFTKGIVSFNGNGVIPTLDLEATTTLANNNTVSLVIGGTAEKPTITLSGSPPLPSDEVLSELLFGQATTSLSPFQAASLAAALASLSGVGGSAVSDPLGGVRNALGLDELSLGGSGSGPPTVQAGRYVAPGVYVGAQQSTSGQGTQATVQINLYKGLKLNTSTGTSGSGSGNSSSVGLTYQFNY